MSTLCLSIEKKIVCVYVANYKELIIIERRQKVRAHSSIGQREKDRNQCWTLMMKQGPTIWTLAIYTSYIFNQRSDWFTMIKYIYILFHLFNKLSDFSLIKDFSIVNRQHIESNQNSNVIHFLVIVCSLKRTWSDPIDDNTIGRTIRKTEKKNECRTTYGKKKKKWFIIFIVLYD